MDNATVSQKMEGMKKQIFIGFVVLGLLAVAAYLFGSGKVKRIENAPTVPTPASSLEQEHARTLEEIAIPILFGNIKSIDENTITVDVPKILGVEIPLNSPRRSRTITVSSETKIFDRFSKSDSELMKEIDVYRKINPNGPPPEQYKLTQISLDALKVGDGITIEAEVGLDLKDIPAISATKITRIHF